MSENSIRISFPSLALQSLSFFLSYSHNNNGGGKKEEKREGGNGKTQNLGFKLKCIAQPKSTISTSAIFMSIDHSVPTEIIKEMGVVADHMNEMQRLCETYWPLLHTLSNDPKLIEVRDTIRQCTVDSVNTLFSCMSQLVVVLLLFLNFTIGPSNAHTTISGVF